ncbi:uncharacterized protein Dana_GF25264 [Drosophila ananassae]|uniref:Carbohydrate kinase PfkB domain-containing protein n=1 Tax=Drosophila ananassae TaxID=7217 RepID=B3M466_DROAN|nr:ketohexokinase [Drosophila ananassae]EDV39336.1 uncharacterized protein Dana_GF25264 [Drosophila ananassae]
MQKSKEYGSKLSWAAGKKPVLCVGATSMDHITFVDSFPNKSDIIKARRGYWQRGGSASNNCTVLRVLGVKCEFFGMLSNLDLYQVLVDDMESRGIVIKNCPYCNMSPNFSSVFFTKALNTRNIIAYNNTAFPNVTIEDFRKLDLTKYGWIHLHCLHFESTMAMIKDVVAHNQANPTEKITISLTMDEPLSEMWPLLDYCDYAFFSKRLSPCSGWKNPKEACVHIDETLRMRWGLNLVRPYVIVLWGSLGGAYMDKAGNYTAFPAYKPKNVVDVLGAGDCFVSSFIYAMYIRDRPLKVSMDFATRMAGYKCTHTGYDHIAKILLPPVL